MAFNFSFLPLFPSFYYPPQQYLNYLPNSQEMPKPDPPVEIAQTSESKKKYQRIWSKTEMADLFSLTMDYCQQHEKSIESLNLSDFIKISVGKRQTPEQIMIKIKEIKANGTLRPGRWSKEEDEMLTALVSSADGDWGQIAQILNTEVHKKLAVRNSKSCKERWNNYLNPEIKRGNWSGEEDLLLLKGYMIYGNKWKSITGLLPHRIEGSIKNRVKSLLHKLKQKYITNEEVLKKVKEMCQIEPIEIKVKETNC